MSDSSKSSKPTGELPIDLNGITTKHHPYRWLWVRHNSIKQSAKIRNVPFNLTIEQLYTIYPDYDPDLEITRINRDHGYTLENIQATSRSQPHKPPTPKPQRKPEPPKRIEPPIANEPNPYVWLTLLKDEIRPHHATYQIPPDNNPHHYGLDFPTFCGR